MSNQVVIVDNSEAWLEQTKEGLMSKLLRMGYSILGTSRIKAPMSEGGGNLRNSGRVKREGNTVVVSYGGMGVDYAGAQEAGTNGIVVYRHYTTPGTGAHYLEDSGNKVVQKGLGVY